MTDARFLCAPRLWPLLMFLSLLTAGLVLVAAPPPKAGLKEAAPSLTLRRQALFAAHPGLSDEAAVSRLRRLEAAWSRAQALGLLTGPGWEEAVQEGRRQILGRAYLDRCPGHAGMSEDQIRAAFLTAGDQRRIAHILCRTEAEAAAVRARLQKGEAFAAVAAEVSKDPGSAGNGGDLGWVRQRELVPAFGTPVFAAAPGTLVGPIHSEFGWHLALTSEVRSPQPEAYVAQREILLKQAAEAQLAVKRDAALEGLRKRYPLRVEWKLLDADRSTEAVPGDEARIAGRVAGVAIPLKALKQYLTETLRAVGQSHALGASIKARFMEDLADRIRLAAAAEKQGLPRQPQVQAALWVDQRERAQEAFSADFLAKVAVPESELQRQHAAHPERFRPVGALRLQVLVADSRARVDEALTQVRKGMAWRVAAERYGSAEATGDPEPGWVEVEALRRMVPPTLMQPLLAGPLGQPVGPMLGADGFMIFNVLERRPGPVPPLEKCREVVRADYLREQGRALVEQELDRLSARP